MRMQTKRTMGQLGHVPTEAIVVLPAMVTTPPVELQVLVLGAATTTLRAGRQVVVLVAYDCPLSLSHK
jgi:hypothetical protein